MGCEALVAVLISRLLKRSNVISFVEYEPIVICYQGEDIPGCVSRSFRGKDEMLVPFERLHRAYTGKGLAAALAGMTDAMERIRYTVDFVEQTTGLTGVGPYLTLLLELDALFLNEDRHTNNLAFIRNEKTKEFCLCPIFDNGLSLLSDLNEYPLDQDMYHCITRVQAKPFAMDFDAQLDAVEELYGIQVMLDFTRQDVPELMGDLRELYAEDILARAERVLYEQIRKYPIFF